MATYRKVSNGGRSQATHRWVVEAALGRPLRGAEQIHHVDGDRNNNTPNNLVVCPNAEYHRLLHLRTEALAACGNPNYRKCVICGTWADPVGMDNLKRKLPNGSYKHTTCARIGGRRYKAQKRGSI